MRRCYYGGYGKKNEIVQFKDGNYALDVSVFSDNETVWLNQK